MVESYTLKEVLEQHRSAMRQELAGLNAKVDGIDAKVDAIAERQASDADKPNRAEMYGVLLTAMGLVAGLIALMP